jgi:hypothetical protein
MTTETKPIPETITLERTGQPPLKFDGTLLTTACGQFVQPPKNKPNTDYFTVSLYATHDARRTIPRRPPPDYDPSWPLYVVAIEYTKTFRDTQQHHTAIATDDPTETLANYAPLAVLIGFPPGEDFAERQQALEGKMRRQYDVLVSAVLKDFPETLSPTRLPKDCEAITVSELERCAQQLGRSQAGRATLKYLLAWLDDTDINLDGQNQEAVFTLLEGAWGGLFGTARDVMRDNL